MRTFAKGMKNVNIIEIKEKNKMLLGKKYGITEAVRQAKYEYIFMTDADCIVNKKWIIKSAPYFTKDVGMLLGHVEYFERNLFDKFRNIEMLAGTIFTFSLAPFSFSPYCRGGNLAFKKSVFIKAKGYENTPKMASGDDTFLLQKLQTISKVVPIYEKESFIKTAPEKEKRKRFEQAKRKYGKNFLMKSPHLGLFLFGIFYHLFLLYTLLKDGFTPYLLTILELKFFIEWCIFIIGTLKLGRTRYIFIYPLFIIFYPFKIIIFSLLGHFSGYRWKSDEKIH
jgi:hypothetical protein